MQHEIQINCHKKEIIVGQDSGKLVAFRARRAKVSEEVSIGNLHGTNQISGTDLVFMVWWSVEGIYRSCIA